MLLQAVIQREYYCVVYLLQYINFIIEITPHNFQSVDSLMFIGKVQLQTFRVFVPAFRFNKLSISFVLMELRRREHILLAVHSFNKRSLSPA
jgi:hypothetical protein